MAKTIAIRSQSLSCKYSVLRSQCTAVSPTEKIKLLPGWAYNYFQPCLMKQKSCTASKLSLLFPLQLEIILIYQKTTKKRETINTPRKHFFLTTLIGNFPPQAAKLAMHLSSEQIIVYQMYQSQPPICLIFSPRLNIG